MKKKFAVLLITFLTATQTVKAQLDMAFISSFKGSSDIAVNRLTWTVTNNKGVKNFYIQRSINGTDFKTIGTLPATEKANTENYEFLDSITSEERIMYRLTMVSKNQHEFSSKIIVLKSKMNATDGIKIIGNPAKDQLCFNYHSTKTQQTSITIYSLSGKLLFEQQVTSVKGNNAVIVPLHSGFSPGLYVLGIKNDLIQQTSRFMKL